MTKLAVVRMHGQVGLRSQEKNTLTKLGLSRKFTCVVVEDTPSMKGMIHAVKDQVTWGELDDELSQRFGETKILHLHPPRGGFERKGTKKPFTKGGALGYRGKKMPDLLKRML